VGGFVCLLVFGVWQGWWKVPADVYAALGALAVVFLRAGVSREIGGVVDAATLLQIGNRVDGRNVEVASTATPPTASSGPGAAGKLIVGLLVALLVLGAMLTGCGKATLELGGAYAPTDTNGVATVKADLAFFEIDSGFDLADSAVRAVMKFERNNRSMLWKVSPDIKHTLDGLRPQIVQVETEYALARKAYMANPVPASLDTLQEILAKAQQLNAAAQAVIPNSNK
jgi:hypothetical protein